jgi:hypothetical protein
MQQHECITKHILLLFQFVIICYPTYSKFIISEILGVTAGAASVSGASGGGAGERSPSHERGRTAQSEHATWPGSAYEWMRMGLWMSG